MDLKEFFSQRIRAPFKPLYIEPYDKEFELEEICEDRETTIVKGIATDLARKTRNEEYQKASKTGTLDEMLEEMLYDELEMNEDTQLIETLGFVKMNMTKEFFFKVDCLFNLPPKNPHCVVMIPNYEGGGFNLDETVIVTDVDRESPSLFYQFAEEAVFRKAGEDQVADLQYVLVLVVEILISQEQVEVEQIAFTVIPNKAMDFYLHGVFQLPLYAEIVLFKDLEFLKDINFWEIALMCQKRYLNGEMNKTNGTVVVRIGPVEIEDVYPDKNDPFLCNSMFMGSGIVPDDCLFTRENIKLAVDKSKKLTSIITQDYDKDEVKEIIKIYLQNVLLKEASVKEDPEQKSVDKNKEKKEDPPSDEEDIDRSKMAEGLH